MSVLRCDGMSRRSALQVGHLTGLGITMPTLLASRPGSHGPAKNCILIWLDGGPSHLETFDLKPDAPQEVRGPLAAVSTSVSGVGISECLPQLAKTMHQMSVIRSMTSPLGEHNLGTHYLLTGYRPTPVLTYPSFQAVVGSQRPVIGKTLPDFIAIPQYRVGGASYDGHGFLPTQYGPFSVGGDPGKSGFQVQDLGTTLSKERLDRRKAFAKRFDSGNPTQGSVDEQEIRRRAFELVTSPQARQAFDLEQESVQTRNRYGRKTIGQSCLLARRLVERGVSFVTVNNRGWDTHNDLKVRLKDGFAGSQKPVGLLPSLDLAASALISDLSERGLLDETLVLIMGEFGRTPKLNTLGGRDHWPRAFSVALAGGGIQPGRVVGSTDATGESPVDNPVTPADLVRTIYTLMGVDPATELQTSSGRPIRVSPESASLIEQIISG